MREKKQHLGTRDRKKKTGFDEMISYLELEMSLTFCMANGFAGAEKNCIIFLKPENGII